MTQDEKLAIQKLLTPLRNIWPAIYSELIAACEREYEPERLGEILVMEFTKLIDQINNEKTARPISSSTSGHESKMNIFKLTQDMEILNRKYKDIERRVVAQNELIANQYQQIQNLTGQTNPE